MKQFALFLLFSLLCLSLWALEPGDQAAPFANPDLTGTYVMSNQVIGKGWVILDFFATWCEPCKKKLPEIDALQKEFAEKGLVTVLFAVDKEGKDIVAPFFEANPAVLRVVIDRYAVAYNRYGVEGVPTIFLINPEGKIVLKQTGYSEGSTAEIRAILVKAYQ